MLIHYVKLSYILSFSISHYRYNKMFWRLSSSIASIRKNKSILGGSKIHTNHSNIHDSNEDILRIIKLYNQGTMKTVNDEATLNGIKYPCLLKYRASNLYVYLTAALSIFASVIHYNLLLQLYFRLIILNRFIQMVRYLPSHCISLKVKSNQPNLYKPTI